MNAPRPLLRSLFDAAVVSAQPEHCIPRFLPGPPVGRTVVIGAGKVSGHGFFEALGDSLVTGPTLTNVNDFRAIFVTADAPTASRKG